MASVNGFFESRYLTELEWYTLRALEELEEREGELDPEKVTPVLLDALRAYGDGVAEVLLGRMGPAIADEDVIRTGFEERLHRHWRPALQRLEAVILAAHEAGDMFAKEQTQRGRRPILADALIRIHARSCLVAREILTLLHTGFASGAHARWRTLHELAVTAFFVSERGQDVARAYLDHANIIGWRNLTTYQAHAVRLGERPVPADEVEELRREQAALIGHYGPSFGGDWGWAAWALGRPKARFVDVEVAVDMGHFRPYFQMANHPVHAGARGLYFDLGAKASRGQIYLTGASNTGLEDPGRGTAISLSQATAALLLADVTPDRFVYMQAIAALARSAQEAFAACGVDMDRRVAINHGHAARRAVVARRASAGATRAQLARVRKVTKFWRSHPNLRARPPRQG